MVLTVHIQAKDDFSKLLVIDEWLIDRFVLNANFNSISEISWREKKNMYAS